MAWRPLPLVAVVAASGLWLPLSALASPPTDDSEGNSGGERIANVDFERHVAGLLGRLGCNSAACHGSFQGQGGFRLSLFGQSPEMDFEAIGEGRVDVHVPDDSLLLRKPSGREEHGGGICLPEKSWEYEHILRWIAAGAVRQPGRGRVRKLEVEPSQIPPLSVGQSVPLRVRAHFADGDDEDVTTLAEFRSRNELVAVVDSAGQAVARSPGEATIIASYRGAFASVSLIVPYVTGGSLPREPLSDNLIDTALGTHSGQLGLAVSPRATDEEFHRRATIDVLGIVPSPDEVREFLADSDPRKREKKIDALLAHPRRAALWATRMCDITACNLATMEFPEEERPKRAKMWHDWFRKRFADNTHYDEIARGVLLATSRGERSVETWIDQEIAHVRAIESGFETEYAQRPMLDLFWRRIGPDGPVPVEDLAELVASAFLGVRLHCARCHQHPYDRWTQADFAGFANIFARVEFGSSTELRTAMNERLEERRVARQQGQAPPELPRVLEVFDAPRMRPLVDSVSAGQVASKIPGGPELASDQDPRQAFVDWLIESPPQNPYFARNFINRVWAKYFGSGLIEPVDGFSAANPPRFGDLLDRLADEFTQSGYDIIQLERLILSSRAYQRSAVPVGNNAEDHDDLAHAPIRPLMAEVVVDSLNSALEDVDDFGPDVPPGSQAIELAPNRFADPQVNELFRVLGRGDRKSLCECDRETRPSLRQSMFLLSDPRVLRKIREGRLARLIAEGRPNSEIVDEFYLATLSRLPDADERAFVLDGIATSESREQALCDFVWALINTREFQTNH